MKPRGNKGELAAIPLSADPERARRVFVNGKPYDLENVWRHGNRVVFKFAGIDSINDAETLAGADVSIPREERAPLPEGEYYQTDLVGCSVTTRDGADVGTVEGWQEFGGPPLLVVRSPAGKEILIPFARSICVEMDVPGRRIVVALPEGLLDL